MFHLALYILLCSYLVEIKFILIKNFRLPNELAKTINYKVKISESTPPPFQFNYQADRILRIPYLSKIILLYILLSSEDVLSRINPNVSSI